MNATSNSKSPETRRSRIIGAARKQFLYKGFRRVDLSQLAKSLGMSKKTIYLEFENKRALVDAVLNDKMSEVRRELTHLMRSVDVSCADGIKDFFYCVQTHLSEINPLFLADLNKDFPELFDVVVKTRRELIPKIFGQLISKGQKSGKVRRDIPMSVVVATFLACIEGVLNPAKLEELSLTPKSAFELVHSIVMQGILVDR